MKKTAKKKRPAAGPTCLMPGDNDVSGSGETPCGEPATQERDCVGIAWALCDKHAKEFDEDEAKEDDYQPAPLSKAYLAKRQARQNAERKKVERVLREYVRYVPTTVGVQFGKRVAREIQTKLHRDSALSIATVEAQTLVEAGTDLLTMLNKAFNVKEK